MTWIAVGAAAVSMITGMMGSANASKAQQIILKAQVEADNNNRKGSNMVSASNTAMINTMRAEDTKQKFKAAGEDWKALNKNIVRIEDQLVRGKANERIQAAEEAGALAAGAAFNGIGGSTVAAFENQLRTSIAEQADNTRNTVDQQVGDMLAVRDSLFMNAAAAVDSSTSFASIDKNVSQVGYIAKENPLKYVSNFLTTTAPYIQNQLGQIQMNRAQAAEASSFNQGIKSNAGARTKI